MSTLKNSLIVIATAIVAFVAFMVTGAAVIALLIYLRWEFPYNSSLYATLILLLPSSTVGLFAGWAFLHIIRANSDISAATLAGLLACAITLIINFVILQVTSLDLSGASNIVIWGYIVGLPLVVALMTPIIVYKWKNSSIEHIPVTSG